MTVQPDTDIKARTENVFSLVNDGHTELARQKLDGLLCSIDDISDAFVLADLAELCMFFSNLPMALRCLEKSTEKHPDNAVFLGLKGRCLVMAHRYKDAIIPLQKALQKNPGLQKAIIDLATALLELKQTKEALSLLDAELPRSPDHPDLHRLLAIAHSNRGNSDIAIQHANKALQSASNAPYQHLLLYLIGRNLSELGQTDAAAATFRQSIAIEPNYGIAYHGLAQIQKFSVSDLPLIETTEKSLLNMALTDDRSMAHFALGKMYDDIGRYEEAFYHYQRGNTLRKQSVQPRENRKLFLAIKNTFPAASLSSKHPISISSGMPVFIVGMPRSGSTLVEQILSSHPDVAAGGELAGINRISDVIQSRGASSGYNSGFISACNDGSLTLLAREYLEFLRSKAHGTKHVTDKEPSNYLHLGLIHTLFPDSLIIHVTRNPLDTLLSCYFQPFENIHWSSDLQWIADEFVFYREVMDYWNNNLPPDRIINLCYETLIAHPEDTIRSLLQQCHLPWDDRCLNFHRKDSQVRTASLHQVRQPLYQSSRARWLNYRHHLQPAAALLEAFLTQAEKQALRVCA